MENVPGRFETINKKLLILVLELPGVSVENL